MTPSVKSCNWYGWSNPKAGYGIVNLEYSTALARLGIDISYGWERREHMMNEDFEMLTSEQKFMLTKPFKKEKVGIIKTTPQMFYMNNSEFRIGYTMVENTKISERWVGWCNEMDAMFVPSEFLVGVFTTCGVTKPIKVVKQGVDPIKFPYYNRTKKDKFVFGTIGYMDDRKNWQDLIVAFSSEFSPEEPVELWIKNSNSYFAHKQFKDPRIKIIHKLYSFDQIQKLYPLFDCYICPSHAEGSSLTPREAMATGLPTILTNWSGMSEICNSEFNFPLTPVSIDFPEPEYRAVEQPGFQARLDVKELMYWMRWVYENQDEAKKMGLKASEYIHKEWCWEVCAKDLLVKLGELL